MGAGDEQLVDEVLFPDTGRRSCRARRGAVRGNPLNGCDLA